MYWPSDRTAKTCADRATHGTASLITATWTWRHHVTRVKIWRHPQNRKWRPTTCCTGRIAVSSEKERATAISNMLRKSDWQTPDRCFTLFAMDATSVYNKYSFGGGPIIKHQQCPGRCRYKSRRSANKRTATIADRLCHRTTQETLLAQTDRATRYVSRNLVNCRNKLYDKSTTNRSNGVRGLQLTDL